MDERNFHFQNADKCANDKGQNTQKNENMHEVREEMENLQPEASIVCHVLTSFQIHFLPSLGKRGAA